MPQHYTPDQVASAFGVPIDQVEYLGTGNFGETWRVGTDTSATASKIIHRAGYSQTRLDREIDGLRRVNHGAIVRLIGVRMVSIGGANRPVLDFEYVPGGDAERALATTPPSHPEALAFARQVCAALVVMHAQGIVHRDIKGANVALRDGQWGNPVLLDFGLALLLDGEAYTQYPLLPNRTLLHQHDDEVVRPLWRKPVDQRDGNAWRERGAHPPHKVVPGLSYLLQRRRLQRRGRLPREFLKHP